MAEHCPGRDQQPVCEQVRARKVARRTPASFLPVPVPVDPLVHMPAVSLVLTAAAVLRVVPHRHLAPAWHAAGRVAQHLRHPAPCSCTVTAAGGQAVPLLWLEARAVRRLSRTSTLVATTLITGTRRMGRRMGRAPFRTTPLPLILRLLLLPLNPHHSPSIRMRASTPSGWRQRHWAATGMRPHWAAPLVLQLPVRARRA